MSSDEKPRYGFAPPSVVPFNAPTAPLTPAKQTVPEPSPEAARIRPRLRSDVSRAVVRLLESLGDMDGAKTSVTQSCLSCGKFNEETEICGAYQARPPARVIAYGCPEYVDELDIPF